MLGNRPEAEGVEQRREWSAINICVYIYVSKITERKANSEFLHCVL